MIFDIKMDGKFTRKARLVAGGHTTDPPASATYSSVVSRDSVRIAFMMAALNDLEVCAADVGTRI
jgi:Reverse transcriptase (RNA-dependent DNA polymerase).